MYLYPLVLLAAVHCCAQGPPVMLLNGHALPSGSEATLTAGADFTLRCRGNGTTAPVRWASTAFKLRFRDLLPDVLTVRGPGDRHTGTYACSYSEQSLRHLQAWVHIYVTDPSRPDSLFVTPRQDHVSLREGQDFLFRCLLTDPSAVSLAFRPAGGGRLPQGMTAVLDRHRGALLTGLRAAHSGSYVCSGRREGRELSSGPVEVLVSPRISPSVSFSPEHFVRIVGEQLFMTCVTSNQNHFYNITWTHSGTQELGLITSTQTLLNNQVHINRTVSVAAVDHRHAGTYTCTATNQAGTASATATLRVVDGPYLRCSLQPVQRANVSTNQVYVNGKQAANVSTNQVYVNGKQVANVSTNQVYVNGKQVANVSTNQVYVNGKQAANVSGGGADADINNDINNDTTDVSGDQRRAGLVEVDEGQDVRLTFLTEAYPPVLRQWWTASARYDIGTDQETYSNYSDKYEASLLLRRVRAENGGRYTLHYTSPQCNGSQHLHLRINRSPSAVVRQRNSTLTCTSSGYPLPRILWYICPRVSDTCDDNSTHEIPSSDVLYRSEEEEGEEEQLEEEQEEEGEEGEEEDEEQLEEEVQRWLTLPLSSDDVIVECVAFNNFGTSRDFLIVPAASTRGLPATPFLTPNLIGASSAAVVLLLLLLVVLYKYKQKPKYEVRWKIIESYTGNNYSFVDPTQLPYNQKWEFPRDQLRLGAVLGAGAFGKVVEATAYGLGTEDATRVAVKMLKPRAHSEEREALMSELKILSHLGYHDNIVNLLGACTRGGPMLMITEYCCHGDLLNFLRGPAQACMAAMLSVEAEEERRVYKNMAAQRVRSDSGISCCSEPYQEMHPALPPGHAHSPLECSDGSDSLFLDVGYLLIVSYQVSQGMDFLASRNCIHRDVAARNVLLTDRGAKICDFGLARDIMTDHSYIVKGNARLPVKWMAPESIFDCVYTVQSDVWSYGILLWEIFSLGKSPYPSVVVDTNFYKMIKDGCHMTRPDFAPPEMYQIMTMCWNLEPTERPTFDTIGRLIKQLFPQTDEQDKGQPTCRNVQDTSSREEERREGAEEEGKGGGEEGEMLKGGEEEEEQEEEEEPLMMMMKKIPNIYHQC